MTWTRLLWILCFAGQHACGLRCACEQDPSCENSNYCTVENGGQCFASLYRTDDDNGGAVEVTRRMLCLTPDQLLPPGRPFICEYNRRQTHKYISGCCQDGDFCNAHLQLVLNITEKSEKYGSENTELLVPSLLAAFFGGVLLLALIGTALRLILFKKHKRKDFCSSCNSCWSDRLLTIKENNDGYTQVEVRSHTESTVQAGAGITAVTGSELNDYLTNTNSGSGSGLPLLVQRSVARQVQHILIVFRRERSSASASRD